MVIPDQQVNDKQFTINKTIDRAAILEEIE
jgi:hypothetical protein